MVAGTITNESEIRAGVLKVLQRILGYPPEPDIEDLRHLDSLQVLELLVSLEDEFDVDSDLIIGARSDWWESLTGLVQIIQALGAAAESGRA
jgi:acyl carrier protein